MRPLIVVQVFRDAASAIIDYGSRWEGSPPEKSYAVASNLERYAPLHDIADALIAWLTETFDVAVVDDVVTANDLLLLPESVVRSVRVAPADSCSAPITFVYSGLPGIFLHAGHLHDSHFPTCGCDACDESVDGCLDDLEWVVRTIVRGGFSETVTPGREPRTSYKLVEEGARESSGGSDAFSFAPDRTRAVAAAHPGVTEWRPWPPRR